MSSLEHQLVDELLEKFRGRKYEHWTDFGDRAVLKANFWEKLEALNQVRLTEKQREHLLDEIVIPNVFAAGKTVRGTNSFIRDDGPSSNFVLIDTVDWCRKVQPDTIRH